MVNETASMPLEVPEGAEPPCQFIVCAEPPICTALGILAVAPWFNINVRLVL